MSRLRFPTVIAVLACVGLVGAVGVSGAGAGALSAPSRACGQDTAGPASPTLSVVKRAQLSGGVLVATATRSIVVAASGRISAAPASGPKPAPGQAWLTFCLRAGNAASAIPLLDVSPGLTLTLGSRRVLQFGRVAAGRVRGARHVALSAPAQRIQLRLGVPRGQAALIVGSRRRATIDAPLSASVRVVLGRGRHAVVIPLSRAGSPKEPSAPSQTSGQPTAPAASQPGGTTMPAGPGVPAPGATAPGGAPAGAKPSGGTAAGGTTPVGVPAVPGPVPWPGNPFSLTSFWNAPLSPLALLDPNSAVYVSDLQAMVAADKPWLNTTSYSTPVYVVGAGQATQHITLDYNAPDLQAQFNAVPLPAGAVAAGGSDAQLTVWQPSADKLWEFFHMHRAAGGWHAGWGGEMDDVSGNPGYFTYVGESTNWGATATGLPLLGGLVTLDDLQRGVIDHALAIAIPQAAKGVWSWPAQRGDGGFLDGGGTTYIPEGTRFRLDPTVNVASLNLPPVDRMLALAAQQFGVVVRDQSGSVSFYGQDPTPAGSNPWPAAFGHQDPAGVLAKFPWGDLQALQPPS